MFVVNQIAMVLSNNFCAWISCIHDVSPETTNFPLDTHGRHDPHIHTTHSINVQPQIFACDWICYNLTWLHKPIFCTIHWIQWVGIKCVCLIKNILAPGGIIKTLFTNARVVWNFSCSTPSWVMAVRSEQRVWLIFFMNFILSLSLRAKVASLKIPWA